MLRLYNTALLPLRVVAAFWSRFQKRDPSKSVEWSERLGHKLPSLEPGCVWIHGSSVGEARITTGLARAVRARRPRLPLAVSAYTATGRRQLLVPPQVDAAFFAPLDFPGPARRVLDALRPALLALVETELWPNLLHHALHLGIPVVVLNGRLSRKKMSRYRRLSSLYRPLLTGMSRVGVQSSDDAERFVELGAPAGAVTVTGNVKYDLPLPELSAERLREQIGLAADRPVFVAGSTGEGEEALVLDAFEQVRRHRPDLLLLLAPRHPERIPEVERLVAARGFGVGRLSRLAPSPGRLDAVLVDTLGQLAALYRLARVAFVGGSLIPVGGHNVLEPASVGVPVLFGPHTENFVEPAEALEQAGGGLRVADSAELAEALRRIVEDEPLRARMARHAEGVVSANRGALERSLTLLLSALPAGTSVERP